MTHMGHFVIDDADNIEELRRIAPDLAPSIAKLRVPAYVLDRTGTVRWMNAAAIVHFGDLRGRAIRDVVAPEYLTLARAEFAAKVLGTVEATEAQVVLRSAEGKNIPVDISSTQLVKGNSIVGVFGLADPAAEPLEALTHMPHLTPRQLDVLRHLAAGHSTESIAQALGIATETVRNHVRAILGKLGVHTRLEAVIRAHDLGLI
jgi:DNA-binding CsgD family transcriptional regulator